MSRMFTDSDIEIVSTYPENIEYKKINADREDLIEAPMWYHAKNLQQTTSGYGKKLNSGYKINLNGRLLRVYVAIFSNNGTMYVKTKKHGDIIIDA